MKTSPSLVLTVAITAAITAAATALILRARPDSATKGIAMTVEAQAGESVEHSAAPPGSRPVAPAGEPSPTKGQVLREFWGAEYPAVEEEALRQGIDLDAPSECHPWSEVREKVLEKIVSNDPDISTRVPNADDWPAPINKEFLRAKFGEVADSLSAAELLAVESLARPYSQSIASLGAKRNGLLLEAMIAKFQAGEYEKSPVFRNETSPVKDRVVGRIIFMDGWIVDLHVMSEDVPALGELDGQIEAEKALRKQAVGEYLAVLE